MNWKLRVDDEFREALESGTTDEWRLGIEALAKIGRCILDDLRRLPTLELPADSTEVRDVLMQSFDLMRELYEGIGSLEGKL